MQNGTYRLIQKGLNNEYKLVVYNGSLKLLNKDSDSFIRTITQKDLSVHYEVKERLPGSQNSYDIVWIVNGNPRERIRLYASYAVIKYKIAELRKRKDYSQGILIPIRSDKHEI